MVPPPLGNESVPKINYIYVYFTTKVVQKSVKNKINKSDRTRARGMYKYIQP